MSDTIPDAELVGAVKDHVWKRFIRNVSMEEDPAQELLDAGYHVRVVPVITAVAQHYRETGEILT